MEGGGNPPQGRKDPPGVQVASAPAKPATTAITHPHPPCNSLPAGTPWANEGRGESTLSWWGETHEEWYEPEGGKGWRRGASRPAWGPAQNADFGWMPDIPGMPSKQEVLNANPWRKKWLPRNEWKTETGKQKD